MSKQQQAGIAHHAAECEAALKCAAFAEVEMAGSESMVAGLRRKAAYHADLAMQWAVRS